MSVQEIDFESGGLGRWGDYFPIYLPTCTLCLILFCLSIVSFLSARLFFFRSDKHPPWLHTSTKNEMPRWVTFMLPTGDDILSNLQLKKAAINSFWQKQPVPRRIIRYTTLNRFAIFYTHVSLPSSSSVIAAKGCKVLVVSWHVARGHAKASRFTYVACLVLCHSRGIAGTNTVRFSGFILFHMWRCNLFCWGCHLFFYSMMDSSLTTRTLTFKYGSPRSGRFFLNDFWNTWPKAIMSLRCVSNSCEYLPWEQI